MKFTIGSIITIFLAIVAVSNITNIVSQLTRLEEARQENREISEKILKLKEENQQLELQIGYATSSAFLNQQARKLLGLGSENDYWINLPSEGIDYGAVTKAEEPKIVPNWKQWLLLFTGRENMLK